MTVITRNRERQSRKNHFLPILDWLPGYDLAWLRGDIPAGLTVLALLIPEGMAYAEIAGMPPQTAFYAAPIGLVLYAVFGTSKQLVVAVSAVIATMSAAAVAPLAAAGSPERILFSDSRRHPENHTLPGLLVLRPDEGLFFANADTLRNEIIDQVNKAQTPVRVVLLDLEMSNQLDVPSVDMLVELKAELGGRNVELWLSRLHGPVRDALDRSGVLAQIGPQNIYPRTLESSLEYLSRGRFEGGEDLAVVDAGLKMTLDVIEKLLADPDAGRRDVLENHHRKLTELLQSAKSHTS